MKVIFMGAPEFAVPALDAFSGARREHRGGVYSRAPAPAGRRGAGIDQNAGPRASGSAGIAGVDPHLVCETPRRKSEFRQLAADAAIVAAYGLISSSPILSAPPALAAFNLHGSLLPRWCRRRADPARAIMAGDADTGIGLMRMEEGLDTGPVAREARTPIGAGDTAGDLTRVLSALGARLLAECWGDFAARRLIFHPQRAEGNILRSQDRQERNSDRLGG